MEQIRVSGPLLKGRLVATTTPAGVTSLRRKNADKDAKEQRTTAGSTVGTTGGTTAGATTTGTTTTAAGIAITTAAGATG